MLVACQHSFKWAIFVFSRCFVAAAVLAIFAGGIDGDDDDDVAFLFLFEGISNALKKCLAKGDVDDVSTANAIPLA